MRLALPLLAGLLMAIHSDGPAAAQGAMPPAFPVGWSAEPRGLEHVSNRLPLPCSVNRIAGRMMLSNPVKRPQIVPAVGLDFVASGPAVEMVMLRIEDNGNGTPMLMLKKHGGPRVVADIHIPAAVAYGRAVDFAVQWDQGGHITVTAGGRQHIMTLSAAPVAVEFFVQGGKGDVSEVKFDWQGPAKPACPTR